MAILSKSEFLELITSMPENMTFNTSKHRELFTSSYFINVSSESCVETQEMKKLDKFR